MRRSLAFHGVFGLLVALLFAPQASGQDINGDGRVDAVFTQKQRYNQVCFGGGTGVFTACTDVTGRIEPGAPVGFGLSNQINTTDSALVDWDADGDLDIMFAMEGHANTVCLNDGGGSFNTGTGCYPLFGYATFPYNTEGLAVGDLDGDGAPDVVFANGGNAGLPLNQPNLVCVGFNTGASACDEFGGNQPSTDVALGDVDNDGDLDVLFSNLGASNTVCLNGGRTGNGMNFDCRPITRAAEVSSATSNAVAVGHLPAGFRGPIDAHLDLVFANDGQNEYCFGNGNWAGLTAGFDCGAFNPVYQSLTVNDATAHTSDVAVADLLPSIPGPEIIFTKTDAPNLMCFGLFTCTFAFQPSQTVNGQSVQITEPTVGVAVGDIDVDGKLDVVVANEGIPAGVSRTYLGVYTMVVANTQLHPTSVVLSGGTVGPPDTDGDGIVDTKDTDDDGDGQTDADELACLSDPVDVMSLAADFDADRRPDCVDPDDDNDGVADSADRFPFNAGESVDTDGDGLGNSADPDDDNDGIADSIDRNRATAADESAVFSSDYWKNAYTFGTFVGALTLIDAGSALRATGIGGIEVCTGTPKVIMVPQGTPGDPAGSVEWSCNSTGTLSVQAVVTSPTVHVRKYLRRWFCFRFPLPGSPVDDCSDWQTVADLTTGQSYSTGSPATAGPGNLEPIPVTILNDAGVAVGSFLLDANESLDVQVTDGDGDTLPRVSLTLIAGEVGVTLVNAAGEEIGSFILDHNASGEPDALSFSLTANAAGEPQVSVLLTSGEVDVTVFGQTHALTPDSGEVVLSSNTPPTVAAGGPYSVEEGGTVTVTAVGTDPEGTPLSFAWDLDNDGSFETPGATASVSVAGIDGPAARTIGVQVTDAGGLTATATTSVDVLNVAPAAVFAAPASLNEGTAIVLSLAAASDPSSADTSAGFEYAFDCGSGFGPFGPGSVASCPTVDEGSLIVRGRIADKDGGVREYQANVNITNVAPDLSETLTGPTAPQRAGTAVTVGGTFTDPGTLDTFTCSINWGDGSVTVGTAAGGTCSGTHVYTVPDLYSVAMTVADGDGGSDTGTFTYVVVFTGTGNLTGGGRFTSPAGAYAAQPTLAGRSTFGFSARYNKNGHLQGQTEFEFRGLRPIVPPGNPDADEDDDDEEDDEDRRRGRPARARLKFRSTSYDWLIVSGAEAMYVGSGQINRAGDYAFLVSVVDGRPDRLRIKIWDKATGDVLYDNEPGAVDNYAPATFPIRGSVVIHR